MRLEKMRLFQRFRIIRRRPLLIISFIFITIFPLFIFPTKAAEESTKTIIRSPADVRYLQVLLGRTFLIEVDDLVRDSCWTNIDAVRNLVELEIIRSGFKITQSGHHDSLIRLTALGWQAASQLCVVHSKVSAYSNSPSIMYGWDGESFAIESLSYNLFFEQSKMFSAHKNDSNNYVKSNFEDSIKSFLISLERQKEPISNFLDDLKTIRPSIAEGWKERVGP